MHPYSGQPGEDGFETPDPIEPDSALDDPISRRSIAPSPACVHGIPGGEYCSDCETEHEEKVRQLEEMQEAAEDPVCVARQLDDIDDDLAPLLRSEQVKRLARSGYYYVGDEDFYGNDMDDPTQRIGVDEDASAQAALAMAEAQHEPDDKNEWVLDLAKEDEEES